MLHRPTSRSAALLLATTLAVPAAAQQVSPAPAATPATRQVARHGTRPTGVEDITVTATRRSVAISRVPVSVTAFTQASLDQRGARTIQDVVRFTPGVSFDPITNNVSIRGISSEAGAGTTGLYIDDTPVQTRNLGFNAENTLPELFDLQRVEVLRGPQGTLFGAGSEGGTVRYITPPPSLTDYSEYGRAAISGSAEGAPIYEVGAAAGGPIIRDVLGFRASVSRQVGGGYLDHVDYQTGDTTARNTNRLDLTSYRGALAFAPLEGLLITPSVLYQQRLKGDTDAYFEGLSDPSHGRFRTNSPEFVRDNDRFYLPALNVRYDVAGVSVISNTSYLHRNNVTGYNGTIYNLSYYNTFPELDGSPYAPLLLPTGINPLLPYYISPSRVYNNQRNFTQEVRVQSNDTDARVSYVAGVFYQHNRQVSSEQIQDPLADNLFETLFGETIADYFGAGLVNGNSYINQTNSLDTQIAVFGNATIRIVDGVKIDGGLRYAHTKFSFTSFGDGAQNGGFSASSGGTAENPVTGKVTLSWQINPRNLVYGGYSRGYRVGGADAPVPQSVCADDFTNFGITSTPSSYGSDTVDSFELGAKSRLLHNRLELSASLFTIDWKNIQQDVVLPTCGIQYTANLGQAVSRGFDVQATLRPLDGLTIDSSLSFTDAHYTTNASAGSGSDGLVALKGDSIGDPAWKWSVGAQYDVQPDVFTIRGGQPYIRADYQHTGRPAGTTPLLDPASLSYDPDYYRTDRSDFVSMRGGAGVRRRHQRVGVREQLAERDARADASARNVRVRDVLQHHADAPLCRAGTDLP